MSVHIATRLRQNILALQTTRSPPSQRGQKSFRSCQVVQKCEFLFLTDCLGDLSNSCCWGVRGGGGGEEDDGAHANSGYFLEVCLRSSLSLFGPIFGDIGANIWVPSSWWIPNQTSIAVSRSAWNNVTYYYCHYTPPSPICLNQLRIPSLRIAFSFLALAPARIASNSGRRLYDRS